MQCHLFSVRELGSWCMTMCHGWLLNIDKYMNTLFINMSYILIILSIFWLHRIVMFVYKILAKMKSKSRCNIILLDYWTRHHIRLHYPTFSSYHHMLKVHLSCPSWKALQIDVITTNCKKFWNYTWHNGLCYFHLPIEKLNTSLGSCLADDFIELFLNHTHWSYPVAFGI